ncbi:branched-chain amino acid transport system II carrier protein [Pseudomonas sp. DCB_AW]|uniref:branched-chain amino acid transport system II carrier protein n=1 Tax=Pseudomonas sp. DCB_AW TaxID=2993596 RepID=UPI00224970F3|nr:branched-chain amino acid transport system II carrier protein [Pseudomonas sp. DCB_AW]MCX2684642.1 branched-chain amino acid transport system II carrier protein [Pseudomonas sp. DCB_AW]
MKLSYRDITALGFMTFALFAGAGNIIFPPMIGLLAGENVWIAACGYFFTAVGLPVITIIALARFDGSIDQLSAPLGKPAARTLAIICFLSIGPFFAVPRTATVSFEIGLKPWLGDSASLLPLYSAIYFAVVLLFSLYPNRLLDTVGRGLAPVKILALAVLGIGAFIWTIGDPSLPVAPYDSSAFQKGVTEGYLTMDALAALVFGAIVVNAIKSRGITSKQEILKYSCIAACIAGLGLSLVYASLFKLGLNSSTLAEGATNGATLISHYVSHTYGQKGYILLSLLIIIACLVTAIGVIAACATYFAGILPYSYKAITITLTAGALIISNFGLSKIISYSVPVLTTIYPPCIALVVFSLISHKFKEPKRIIAPAALCSLLFGVIDGANAFGLNIPSLKFLVASLPLSEANLSWLVPTTIIFIIACTLDQISSTRPTRSPHPEDAV